MHWEVDQHLLSIRMSVKFNTKKNTKEASDTFEHQSTAWQYLTHAYSDITQTMAAMDICFGLTRPHQHGKVIGQK